MKVVSIRSVVYSLRTDCVGKWRRWAGLDYKNTTADPPLNFLLQNEYDSSPFHHKSVLVKDHFMETAKNV